MGEMTGMVSFWMDKSFFNFHYQAKHGKLQDERFLRMIGAMYEDNDKLPQKTREYDECSNQGWYFYSHFR
jgi:uncharacterized protein YozE (UPF0346 family)